MDIEGVYARKAVYRASLSQALIAQGRVFHALMLRDIHTRFGSAFGFLLVIAWPLTHIVALVAINVLAGRVAPYGDNAALWFATGIIPFMCFSYMSRFTMMGIAQNKPLLSFPAIKVTDILFARALVELLNAGLVILIVAVIFLYLGIDFTPANIPEAAYAILASMLLGLGFGVINGIVAAMFPFWMTVYALLMLVMWIGSGVLFVPDALPAQLRDALALQPWLQIVEWMRSAYFEGYGVAILDKPYVLAWGGWRFIFGSFVRAILPRSNVDLSRTVQIVLFKCRNFIQKQRLALWGSDMLKLPFFRKDRRASEQNTRNIEIYKDYFDSKWYVDKYSDSQECAGKFEDLLQHYLDEAYPLWSGAYPQ